MSICQRAGFDEEHQNNQRVDEAAKIEVAWVDLDSQHKGELFRVHWARDTSGHQGGEATYRWTHNQGVDLTMDTIAQVSRKMKSAAIKQAKRFKASVVWRTMAEI